VDNLFGNFSAFIYKDGLTYDLNCLTTVPNGWKLSSAIKINNAGEILGYFETSNGTLRSFLLRPGTVTDVQEHQNREKVLPTSYVLAQNYPNPFNPSTTISYQLPSQSNVKLEIFNTLGQKMAQLVNDQQQAGYYEQSWNASSYASGIYFYRLEAVSIVGSNKSFTQIKKMLLLK
jgi:probable HAF family extracellular repeat protein